MLYTTAIYFLYFLLYAIIGWLCEEIYCSYLEKHLVNRGFLNGPYCPIYGVGALIIISILAPYSHSPINVFILGIFLTSALEYFTSWAMEMLFHAKWWDYSDHRYNINGRVCLLNSSLFGLMCLSLMYLVHPFVERLVQGFSTFQVYLISSITAALFLADLITSVRQLQAFNQKLDKLYESTLEFADSFKEKGLSTANEMSHRIIDFADGKLEDATLHLEDTKNQAHTSFTAFLTHLHDARLINRYSSNRIIKAFPAMLHHRRQSSLNLYKALLERKNSIQNSIRK